jgi:hypothetical protein
MTSTIDREVALVCDHADEVTIHVPLDLVRRAQIAMSVYADYGTNDAEHDALREFCALAEKALAEERPCDWRIVIDLVNTRCQLPVAEVLADLPDELADTVTFDGQKVSGCVRHETKGVAQRAATDLLRAVRRYCPDAAPIAVERL